MLIVFTTQQTRVIECDFCSLSLINNLFVYEVLIQMEIEINSSFKFHAEVFESIFMYTNKFEICL